MEQTFLTEIDIKKVRHLENITIPLDSQHRKHLILTGKNGSGKTSVLDSLAEHFRYIVRGLARKELIQELIDINRSQLPSEDTEAANQDGKYIKKHIQLWENKMKRWTTGAITDCTSFSELKQKYDNGNFILAYYKADRLSKVEISSTIEKITLKEQYALDDNPGKQLVKYMVGLKATQAFAQQTGNQTRAKEIENWFSRFENVLKRVFNDPTLTLDFDIENFQFHIHQQGREPFDFNTMSSGYSAVFDIINDLIMRMGGDPAAEKEGIVLIDEIDTHLHLELQRTILPFLTELFPNIQFIVSTHSPFILNSIENAVIFDLETKKIVKNGLANYPYNGIVESFFNTDTLSAELREKFDRYKELTEKSDLTDEDYAEIVSLETELDEIPDFLSPDIASEYSRAKLEFSNRE